MPTGSWFVRLVARLTGREADLAIDPETIDLVRQTRIVTSGTLIGNLVRRGVDAHPDR